jgi:hypothetical protein
MTGDLVEAAWDSLAMGKIEEQVNDDFRFEE